MTSPALDMQLSGCPLFQGLSDQWWRRENNMKHSTIVFVALASVIEAFAGYNDKNELTPEKLEAAISQRG